MSCGYWDIDSILAEEELIPCTNLFDFSHLAHLDSELNDTTKSHLPENSKVKMPIWSMEKWAKLGFVRMSMPRHFSRKARERLEADPGDADLRKRNEHYFLAGRMVVALIERCAAAVNATIASTPGGRRRNAHAMQQVLQEAVELRQTLLLTYTGERFCKTLDWSMSSVGDDVSVYTKRLTEMEKRLFQVGASAMAAHVQWKTFGNNKIHLSETAIRTASLSNSSNARAVSPEQEADESRESKRQRQE